MACKMEIIKVKIVNIASKIISKEDMMIPSTVPPQIPLQGWEKMWENVRKCLLQQHYQ